MIALITSNYGIGKHKFPPIIIIKTYNATFTITSNNKKEVEIFCQSRSSDATPCSYNASHAPCKALRVHTISVLYT